MSNTSDKLTVADYIKLAERAGYDPNLFDVYNGKLWVNCSTGKSPAIYRPDKNPAQCSELLNTCNERGLDAVLDFKADESNVALFRNGELVGCSEVDGIYHELAICRAILQLIESESNV